MPVAVGLIADSYTAPAGAFTPAGLTALAGWWDAADAATFTYGTSPQVASWIDKSPNVFTVSRTPSTAIVRNDTINGVSCVTSTTQNQGMTRASTALRSFVDTTSFTNCMHFVVMSISNITYGGWQQLSGSTTRVGFDMRATVAYCDIGSTGSARLTGTIANTANVPYLFSVYRNGANMKMYRNGVELLTKSNASGAIAVETATLELTGFSANGFTGKIGEIIHVARYNATDFTNTEAYLTTKWGIGTFTPAQIAGLQGWWDASDAASITSSAGAVSAWNDKSGNNRHFTQATGTAQPQTAVTTINSRNVLTFDGTTDYMDTAATTLHNTTSGEWSSFVVCRPTTATPTRPVFDHDRGTGANTQRGPTFLKLSSATPQAVAYSTTPTAFADSGAAYNVNAPNVFAAVRGATTIELWVNTVSAGSTATTGTPNNTTSTIGCRVGGNAAVTPSQFFQGDLAEAIVYNVALSTTDRQTVENYLKTKWGIP